jgi:hypothetical protein
MPPVLSLVLFGVGALLVCAPFVGGIGATSESSSHWNRTMILVLLGVSLVALPTLFAVLPELARWPYGWRVFTLVVWFTLAIAGVIATVRTDQMLHSTVEADRLASVVAEHRANLRDHFQRALHSGIGGMPPHYDLTLYGENEDLKILVPLFTPALTYEDPAIFQYTTGAIGEAWSQGAPGVLVVKGPEVSNDAHGLEVIQQERYSVYEVVAACVIFDATQKKIGALTAIGMIDDGYFESEMGQQLLKSLATSVAWIIPGALRWMQPSGKGT